MLVERVESKWIDTFAGVFGLCAIQPGDVCVVLSESQSRQVNVQLAELALARLGARPFHVTVPTPKQTAPVPVRSTGASDAIQQLGPVIAALASSTVVIDCTVEGLLHSPELPEILADGARVLMISNEHPEALERLVPDPSLIPKIDAGKARLAAADTMCVTSEAGTDLTIRVAGAPTAGSVGYSTEPGSVAHWPGGLCLCFPLAGSVNGSLVLAPGDVNLTFKRYLESEVRLTIEDDYITDISGPGTDAALFASYLEAWDDEDAYAVSHVGWGMNPGARWDALTMYDKAHTNGTELRAFAGNFVYSTGANEHAGRHTLGHFDLPMRNCTVELDGFPVVTAGVLHPELR